ncbi:MAG: YjjI family glycine radical enzyme [Lachnospiraceae bacterium]
MKPITMARVEETRAEILNIIKSPTLTHEQKLTNLAGQADSLLEVLDLPEGLDDLLAPVEGKQCICDLFEGHAPVRPRYIAPDYAKFFEFGSEFLQLKPPTDLMEALNHLLIMYKHVPSVTNYPVYVGALDELLEPFVRDFDEATTKKLLKLFMIHIDRTVLDSFSHANIGPKETLIGKWLLEVEEELEQAVPNITFKYEEGVTPDDYAIRAIKTSLRSAKPSFANHKMFSNEFPGEYVIASCYNGLPYGGGAYTLCRLILGNIAKRADSIVDFKEKVLPHVMDIQARYMDARVRFIVEESGFFENHFLATEGLIHRDRFTGMFGLVGLAEAVDILLEKEGVNARFGHDKRADQLGVEIMEQIVAFNESHEAPYCEVSNGHYLLHAQVGIAQDHGISPGTRIPIGEEPENLMEHLMQCNLFHKYFPSGTGDIFPVEMTAGKNPEYILDIIKGAFSKELRYLSFHDSDSDVIRVTGYLVKRSEIEKYKNGERVLQNTTHLGTGAANNGHILERKRR